MAYSDSPLVTYTRISPNKTSPRNHAIDTITIHCYVGQVTAKQGCDNFATTSREVSSNYVVGKDGSIGLSVNEKDRSWCSSNRANDHRAITIETASDTTHPYAVTDAAYNALIDLCTDICQRNGISELKWKADKSLIGQVDQQNMTVHRWFANKECPGEYLYSRMGQIASAVNARLGSGSGGSEGGGSEGGDVPSLPETDYERVIWDYLLNKLGNEYAVAGLMGNLYAESALRPNNLQNSYEDTLGYTDTTYTQAVDNGSYSENSFVHDSAGYGLAQWTHWSRKQALYNMFKSGGYSSIASIDLQLDYLWYELENDFEGVLSVLYSASSVREASNKVLHDFENPANQSTSVEEKREEYGIYYYNKYANGGTGGSGSDTGGSDTPSTGRKRRMSTFLLYSVALDRY